MRLELVTALLEGPSEEAIVRLLEADDTVFWVDWRDPEDEIVEACETVLGSGDLSTETVDVDTGDGFETYILHGGERHKIPLTYSQKDRHIALYTLNRVLQPAYEVRVCVDSGGGDALAFLPLSREVWADLETRFGANVGRRFRPITEKPNLFTDPPEF